MREAEIREEICRVGRSLFERGYVHATAGNISVRIDDSEGGGFLITPTDACLGFLDPARLARLDAQAKQISGDCASKSITMHQHIYQSAREFQPNTKCVIHTHSTQCVALSLQNTDEVELLPPLTPYFVMKIGHVPLIPYHRPGDPAAAHWVAQSIARYGKVGTPIRAVMQQRLGPNVWHDSPGDAMATLEELEETAKLWTLSNRLAQALGEKQLEDLRLTFGARW